MDPEGRRRFGAIALGAALVAAVALVGAVLFFREMGRGIPSFPSLAAQPDPSLRGTVAYYAGGSGCVRIVAAAGRPSREVLCLPPADTKQAAQLGTKEDGPQLVWRDDGRLEITMFRVDPKNGAFAAGWQKVVDVRTGQVEDVAAGDAPAAPNLTTRPVVDRTGRRLATTSDGPSGRIKVTLTDAGRTRTLLSASGPGQYTYRLKGAFWAPDWQWIAADDGRILVITPGDPAVTRVLTSDTRETRESSGGLQGDDPRLASFAVTAADLL